MLLATALVFCFVLAYLSSMIGLAPIVGSCTAGLILEDAQGEVGLIFANMGLSLTLAGHPIVDQALYSGVVIMVIIMTMATSPLLKWSLVRRP